MKIRHLIPVLKAIAIPAILSLSACATDDRNLTPEQRQAMSRERYSAQPAGSLETPQQRYDENPAPMPER